MFRLLSNFKRLVFVLIGIQEYSVRTSKIPQKILYYANQYYLSTYQSIPAVQRLPADILTQIFENIAIIETGGRRGDRGYRRWIAVTHVCYRWREAAINCAYLWTHIDVLRFHKQELNAYIQRSKQYPLNIALVKKKALLTPKEELTIAISELSHFSLRNRIVSLYMQFCTAGDWSICLSSFQAYDLPNLERLTLINPSDKFYVLLRKNDFRTSNLKYLYLRNVIISRNLPQFANITELEIHWRFSSLFINTTHTEPSTQNLMNTLDSCQKLEVLKIHIHKEILLNDNPWASSICLPNLRLLEFVACMYIQGVLHRHLNLNTEQDDQNIPRIDVSASCNGCAHKLTTISISSPRLEFTSIICTCDDQSESLQMQYYGEMYVLRTNISSNFKATSNLQFLSPAFAKNCKKEDWVTFFKYLPNLQRLTITGSSSNNMIHLDDLKKSYPFLDALAGQSQDENILCPLLKRVDFRYYSINRYFAATFSKMMEKRCEKLGSGAVFDVGSIDCVADPINGIGSHLIRRKLLSLKGEDSYISIFWLEVDAYMKSDLQLTFATLLAVLAIILMGKISLASIFCGQY